MNGIINVLKPPGMTSHDVVSFLRRQLKMKRIGHTGTLDPQAAGVLPVCIGQATRLAEFLSAKDKEYLCRMRLGISTTTQDAWGEVTDCQDPSGVAKEAVKTAIEAFRGRIKQQVPLYSAVKISGEPMYKKARRGEDVTPVVREIEIYNIELLGCEENELTLHIHCSQGTYIRTVCHDLGQLLGVGGHMSFLLRTRSGQFQLQDAYTLEEISKKPDQTIVPMGYCLGEMPVLTLQDEELAMIRHGRSVKYQAKKIIPASTGIVAIVDDGKNLLAMAQLQDEKGHVWLKPKKVFNLEH